MQSHLTERDLAAPGLSVDVVSEGDEVAAVDEGEHPPGVGLGHGEQMLQDIAHSLALQQVRWPASGLG